jgi:predicted metal-dependent HD superfamily phosphohydrolase
MDAGSVEPIHIEFDRMKCDACGHEAICDDYQIKDNWNEHMAAHAIPREQWHLLPGVRFRDLWQTLGARGHGRDIFLQLRAAYDESHRAYHTARHIGACLRLLDDATIATLATRLPEVEAAIWFHDAIYDTRAIDNEERSAELAEATLGDAGVPDEVVARIAAHVRATKHHEADSRDSELVLDIDLSILGERPELFARFEEEIRREYAWVEPADYARARAAVLLRFDEREHIYRTPLFRERYESSARKNIAASLEKMSEFLDRPIR